MTRDYLDSSFTKSHQSPHHAFNEWDKLLPPSREMLIFGASPSSEPSLLAGSNSSSSDDEEAQKKRRAVAIELDSYGLEPAYNLFGSVYININKPTADRLLLSFESVVLPSLFTKIYGRLAIISGLIPSASANIGAYLLANLAYAAWPIALIAGAVRFTYVLVTDLRSGKPWKEALIHASKEALKTAIKFFIVYMIWTLAIALGTSLGILSGGMLPLGIILVGVITALGFMLATFIVDKMPAIIQAIWTNGLKQSWSLFKEKLHELKTGVLPGLLEGSSWTLMDNNLVNISGHVAGLGGQILDLVGISLIVSGFFFIGAVIQSSIARRRAISKLPKITNDPEIKASIQASIEKTVNEKEAPLVALSRLKEESHDPRVQALLVQYMQAQVILTALSQALIVSHNMQGISSHSLSSAEKSWIKDLPPHAVTAASGGLFSRGDYTPREELRQVKEIGRDLSSSPGTGKVLKRAESLKGKVEKRRTAAMRALKQQYGIFGTTEQNGTVHMHGDKVGGKGLVIELVF